MDKFQDKYRITSARLKNWDYRWNETYFITICAQDRENYFGQIHDGKMKLSEIGIIADVMWYEIKNHVENIDLGAFLVMPNHVHGILILKGNESNNYIDSNVETLHATSLPQTSQNDPNKNEFMSNISPKSGSVSAIIRSYKSAVSKHAPSFGISFFVAIPFSRSHHSG